MRPMLDRLFVTLGAAFGLCAVAAGAFGAHALKERLPADLLGVFQTGAQYQMFHALALILTGVLVASRPHPAFTVAGWAFAFGVVLFSGSLYALALTGQRKLGAVTPIGGVAFLAGWAALAVGAVARGKQG